MPRDICNPFQKKTFLTWRKQLDFAFISNLPMKLNTKKVFSFKTNQNYSKLFQTLCKCTFIRIDIGDTLFAFYMAIDWHSWVEHQKQRSF